METMWEDIVENTWELFHVGLVVRDLEKTLDYYQSLGLFTSLLTAPAGQSPPPRTYEDYGEARDVNLYSSQRVRIIRMGPLPIEMVQPPEGGKSANNQFLNSKGDGVAHICFFVDDLEAETAKLVEKGIPIVLTEKTQNRVTMRYFDTTKLGGILLELIQKGTM